MEYERFKLLKKEKELYLYIEQYVYNQFPKSEKILRDSVMKELYSMIKNTSYISVNRGNIRNKYIKEVKSNVIMLDFYFSCLLDKEIVVKKRFLKCVDRLLEISKILNSLENNNEEIKTKDVL